MDLDTEEQLLVEGTEHLMWKVVEMRKQHGAACGRHAQKTLYAQHVLLQQSLQALTGTEFKPNAVPDIDVDGMMADLKQFDSDLNKMTERIDRTERQARSVKLVAEQMKAQNPAMADQSPPSAETLLARAKNKTRK